MAEEFTTKHPVALGLLKASLGFFDSQLEPSMEKNLTQLIETAEKRLAGECKILVVAGDIDDEQLLAMYADWLYSKRKTGAGKPDMLREAIRNRQTRDALNAAAAEVCR